MKRTALLIGNSNGLGGVKVDISNFTKFFMSDIGGRWYDSEIIISMNPTKAGLLSTVKNLKIEKPDFAFVVFSGHGAFNKNTILELNANEEFIYETDLYEIAKRQISIFDCCRNVIDLKEYDLSESTRMMKAFSATGNIRERYEIRIMQAIEQQIQLYACSINESSLDTESGGMYSKNLLSAAKPSNDSLYKLVGTTHQEAAEKTKTEAWSNNLHRQNPTATLPRCLASQQLIFSINPNTNHYL